MLQGCCTHIGALSISGLTIVTLLTLRGPAGGNHPILVAFARAKDDALVDVEEGAVVFGDHAPVKGLAGRVQNAFAGGGKEEKVIFHPEVEPVALKVFLLMKLYKLVLFFSSFHH